MNTDIITQVVAISVFIFITEKTLSQAGKSNYAFIIDLIGFIILLIMVVASINKLVRTSLFYFPI